MRRNVAIVTAWHGRPTLTRQVAKWYVDNHDGPRIAACTQAEETHYGFNTINKWMRVHCPDNIVSDKLNRAVRAARIFDVDAVCIVGSDDLLCPAFMEAAFSRDEDYVYGNGLYMHDMKSRRSLYMNTSAPPGCGRVLSRELLEKLDWRPYGDGLTKCIEASMAERLRPLEYTGHCLNVDPGTGLHILDIKSADNIWPFEKWINTPTTRFVDNDFLAVFGMDPTPAPPYVPPIKVDEYELTVSEDSASVNIRFTVDHEISRESLDKVLVRLSEYVSHPVKLGPLVARDNEGRILA